MTSAGRTSSPALLQHHSSSLRRQHSEELLPSSTGAAFTWEAAEIGRLQLDDGLFRSVQAARLVRNDLSVAVTEETTRQVAEEAISSSSSFAFQ